MFLPSEGPPKVLATGYSSLPDGRKLGVVYCVNRPSAIFELGIDMVEGKWKATSATRQSPVERSSRSPRVLSASLRARFGPLAVFLSNPEGGPHGSCATLHAVNLKTGATTVLVDTVDAPSASKPFPGIFTDQLPEQPFLVLGGVPHVAFTSQWRSRRVPLLVSLATGAVSSLAEWPAPLDDPVLPYLGDSNRAALKSVAVLTTDGAARVVGLRSGLVSPPEIVLLDLQKAKPDWKVIKSTKLSPERALCLASRFRRTNTD